MKKGMLVILTAVLLFVSPLNVTLAAPPQEIKKCDGFRDLCWGQDIKEIQGMQYVATDPSWGGVDKYIRNKDDMTIGPAKLDKIFYGFWRGKLMVVDIKFHQYPNFSSLKESAEAKFGHLFKPNRFLDDYMVKSGDTTVMLEYRQIGDKGSLHMSSEYWTNMAQRESKEQAQKGAAKGF